MMKAHHDVHGLFASHGLRLTRQRAAVFDALASTDSHPTADELYHRVVRNDQSISLATVYNALEAFCNNGLAQKLSTNGASARYDAATNNHLHLEDELTGRVADAPHHLSERIIDALPVHVIRQLEEELGFEVKQIKIEFMGRFRDRR